MPLKKGQMTIFISRRTQVLTVVLLLHSAQTADAQTVSTPDWSVGDTWVVETRTAPVQERVSNEKTNNIKLLWRFEVVGIDDLRGRPHKQIEVKPIRDGRVNPRIRFWTDAKTGFLSKVERQIPFGGKFRQMVQEYESTIGGYAPAMPEITGLPIDLPAFLPPGSKKIGNFQVVSKSGGQAKRIGGLTFATNIRQSLTKPNQQTVTQSNQGKPASKALLNPDELVEVVIDSQTRKVRQLWKKGANWPEYVDNGRTKSWLLSEKRAKK